MQRRKLNTECFVLIDPQSFKDLLLLQHTFFKENEYMQVRQVGKYHGEIIESIHMTPEDYGEEVRQILNQALQNDDLWYLSQTYQMYIPVTAIGNIQYNSTTKSFVVDLTIGQTKRQVSSRNICPINIPASARRFQSVSDLPSVRFWQIEQEQLPQNVMVGDISGKTRQTFLERPINLPRYGTFYD